MSISSRVDRLTDWCNGGPRVYRLLKRMHESIDRMETVADINSANMHWFDEEIRKLTLHEVDAVLAYLANWESETEVAGEPEIIGFGPLDR